MVSIDVGSILLRSIVSFAILLLLSTANGVAQTTESPSDTGEAVSPGHAFLVTGYGSAGFRAVFAENSTPNNFAALIAPIFLFQASDRFLFEAELEFELEEGVTVTQLEYAQVIYGLTNNLKIGAGKFLLPFNVFSERMHPTWINKFVSPPPIYGAHGSAGPAEPLLPVLSDIGVQLRASYDVGEYSFITAVGYVTQGPRPEGEEGEETELPEVTVGTNFEDNNEDKLIGGRVGFGVAPYIEVNVSAMAGAYDDAGDLHFTAYGAHVEGRYREIEFHGEWIHTGLEIRDEASLDAIDSLDRDGYFGQLGYRYGKWVPLVRWTQIFDSEFDDDVVIESGEQLALGLTYVQTPSVLIKLEYLFNREDANIDNDRFAVQWAFGF